MGAYGQPDQRRATDFAFLMPGVQGNNTNGNATTNTGIVNGSGSRGAVSAVYIDGIPFVRAGGNGDPRFVWTAISVDAVDQFQVQTTGYSAIYEGQGIQNYTIKLGGNKYHGSVYEFFRNTALDTWGFFGPANPTPSPASPSSPSNTATSTASTSAVPLVPFGTWRDKLFFFGNYNGFRYSSQTPTPMTFPTAAEQSGNFAGLVTGGIFDPATQAACTANSTNGPCRYRYGYRLKWRQRPRWNSGGNRAGRRHSPSQFSAMALKLQSFLPSGIGTSATNNYISPNTIGLTNWSTTDRIDFNLSSKDTLSMIGRHRTPGQRHPQGQTTAGRNVGPDPLQLWSGLRSQNRCRRHRRDPHLLAEHRQPVQVWLRALQRPHLQSPTSLRPTLRRPWASPAFPPVRPPEVSRRHLRRHGSAHQLGRSTRPTSPSPKTTPCSTTCSGSRAGTPLPSAVRSPGCSITSRPLPAAPAFSPLPVQ